jgi:hypothetical protein
LAFLFADLAHIGDIGTLISLAREVRNKKAEGAGGAFGSISMWPALCRWPALTNSRTA